MYNTNSVRAFFGAAVAASIVGLAGCGGDDAMGRIDLAVTDAPVDSAAAVVITFTGVELQPADGDRVDVTYDAPRQIDLLALQGGLSAPLLDSVSVPAGDYSWIRLKVATDPSTTESFVQLLDGSVHPLTIPSGSQSGLKLHGGVAVAAGGTSSFTVDFDLRKSLHLPMGGDDAYTLRPTLRLVDNAQIGRISGTVDAALLTEGCTPAVYAYTGASVVPDDVGGAGVDPVASAAVTTDTTAGVSSYTLAFLIAGDYTVAFTCQAAADAPDADDAIAFAPVANATVTANTTTTLDLHP